jgi:hypothetical protein
MKGLPMAKLLVQTQLECLCFKIMACAVAYYHTSCYELLSSEVRPEQGDDVEA